MSPSKVKVLVALLLILFLSSAIPGQTKEQTTPDRARLIAVAREIMKAARYCGLITRNSDGTARVRTMDPFAPEEDMTVWLAGDQPGFTHFGL